MTDKLDADPGMPDALEVAARAGRNSQEQRQARRPAARRVLAIKDQFDTFDLRTHFGRRRVLCQRPAAGRCVLRQAAARSRRHHSRQGQHG